MKILYPIIDGEITGGNLICLKIIEEVLERGGKVVVNSPTEGRLTHILREKGIKVYNIDTRRSFYFHSAIKLALIIKKEGINLVHSHTPLGAAILSRLGGWIAGVAVITHIHVRDTMNPNPFVKAYQLLLNRVTSRFFCAKVIAVAETTKREVINQGTAADKITVVYNGIDINGSRRDRNSVEIREEFGLRQNQKIIGEIGRLCESKGQHILIRAARKVIEKIPDTVFIIVGEDLAQGGKYKKELEDLANDSSLKEKIIFTGYRKDIIGLIRAFDIFVLPSSIEGLSLAILEAMAAKKPVITTSVGGNPEIVVDGQTGTIIPSDPDSLTEAILYHLSNPEISRQMGEAGYERVKQHFSLSPMLNKVMNLYKEVLEGKN